MSLFVSATIYLHLSASLIYAVLSVDILSAFFSREVSHCRGLVLRLSDMACWLD